MPYGDHLKYNQPVIDATAFLQRPVMWLSLQNHTADTEYTTSCKYHFITVTAASPVTGKTILPIANYRVMSGSQSNYWPLEHPLMSVNYIYIIYIFQSSSNISPTGFIFHVSSTKRKGSNFPCYWRNHTSGLSFMRLLEQVVQFETVIFYMYEDINEILISFKTIQVYTLNFISFF